MFKLLNKITGKEIYYLLTAAENGKSTFDRADACLDGLCDCLSDIKIKGMIYAGGVWKKGEINSTRYIQQAYDMGAAVWKSFAFYYISHLFLFIMQERKKWKVMM